LDADALKRSRDASSASLGFDRRHAGDSDSRRSHEIDSWRRWRGLRVGELDLGDRLQSAEFMVGCFGVD